MIPAEKRLPRDRRQTQGQDLQWNDPHYSTVCTYSIRRQMFQNPRPIIIFVYQQNAPHLKVS